MAIPLHIDELPDGVRYVLPRRRRRGWLPLLRHAGCAFILYLTVPVLVLGLTFQTGRPWIAPIALVVVLLFLLGGIANVRSAWSILSAPDVELMLATGRLQVRRHSLVVGATTVDIPLGAVRRLVIDSLYEPPPPVPNEPGLPNAWRRMIRVWFGQSVEQRSAEQRRAAVQRFFGALVLEGDDNAAVLLAEGLSQRYLRRLADDLATRSAALGQTMAVETAGLTPQPVAADDPRLRRPDDSAPPPATPDAAGIEIGIPPAGLGRNELAILGFMVFGAGLFAFVMLPQLLEGGTVGVLMSPLWLGLLAIPFGRVTFVTVGGMLRRLRRTTLTVLDGTLRVQHDDRLWRRERRWSADDIAAFTLEERPDTTPKKADQGPLVFDLVLLDHSQGRTILVRSRPEAELEWIAALLHKELGLGL